MSSVQITENILGCLPHVIDKVSAVLTKSTNTSGASDSWSFVQNIQIRVNDPRSITLPIFSQLVSRAMQSQPDEDEATQ
jgi:hypothetical protein